MAPNVIVQFGALTKASAPEGGCPPVFYGLTASRKVGNAVVRNKARRRLRSLAQEILAHHAKTDQSYVLVARPSTAVCDFDILRQDVMTALKRMRAWRE